MKSNCLIISILSLIVFIAILYLLNKNNNVFSLNPKYIEKYEEPPLKAVILNARNISNNIVPLIDIKQLMCDNNTDNSLCLNKYTLSYSNIVP